MLGFNPHPANRPGDARRLTRSSTSSLCFNPHPANRPGDATGASWEFIDGSGFNPHPANRPGDAFKTVLVSARNPFQSAPGQPAG